ncbi:MAG TPA: hypothetical protein VFW19_11160 [Allosphingosinicella sp.]|nr:hypothetical protein [Allosphingosinicella sp.]
MTDRDSEPSVYEKGSSGARADEAAAAAPADMKPGDDPCARAEELLDEAIEETFPASDPISPAAGAD